MLQPQNIKIIVLFTLAVSTFLFSMLPVKVMTVAKKQMDRTKRHRFKKIVSLLSCYAAGVFLATCLLDLFPEVQENIFQALDAMGYRTSFPVPEFVVSFGFFMILIVEQIVLTCKGENSSAGYEPLLGSQDSISSDRHNIPGLSNSGTPTYVPANHPSRLSSADYDSEILPDGLYDPSIDDDEDHGEVLEELTESQMYQDPNSHSVIRSVILLLALSLHSIFEGLAIGLQKNAASVLGIFAPIILHKSILAFSLGMNLVQTEMSLKGVIKSNIVFCVTAPIGIGIGIAIIDLAPDSDITTLIDGTLQGIACGTFLYIVFFEILPHEFMSVKCYPNRLLKLLFMLLGYCTVTSIIFLQPDSEVVRCIGG